MTDTASDLRARAYFLWEVAGRPDGREDEFWSEAERELDAESLVVDEIAVGKPLPEKKSSKPRAGRAKLAGAETNK